MANIIGEPFSSWVKTQIEKRQEALGKTNIDPNTLKWVTTKAPWLRLASSVNIDNSITTKLGLNTNLQGPELAKNFILFGGAANQLGSLQSGINFSNSTLRGEYGWGGNQERGFVPMPGITSADVTYYNNGALAKASVKIKAFSREQFALIDYLYMRPGYSVLLEFGHTVYLDNNGNLQQWDKFQSTPLEKFLVGEKNRTDLVTPLVDQYAIQSWINNEKEKYKGNYEGFIGQISKFSWSFNRDGSYDINIELIAYGSIIESLKMNVVDNTPEDNTTESQTESTEELPTIVAKKEASTINKWLFDIYDAFGNEDKINLVFLVEFLKRKIYTGINTNDFNLSNFIYKFLGGIEGKFLQSTHNYSVYITLASLLHFIETQCGLYNGDSPQVKFDFNYDYFGLTNTGNTEVDRNYFFSPPNQFSADPRVCLIPVHQNLNEIINTLATGSIINDIPLNPKRVINLADDDNDSTAYYNVAPLLGGTFPSSPRNEQSNFKIGNANAFVGKMGYILLNIEYLAGVLSSLTKEEDGVATLVKLLQQIMDDVNVCLGGINNFTVYADRDTQTIRIYDQNPMPYQGSDYEDPRNKEFATLNIFGVRPGVEGSFVQDIQLNSEISPNFSTAISVGAQANSTNVSQNAYSFEKYNKGLTDRIILEKASKNSNGEKYEEGDAPFDLAKFKKIFTEVYGKRQLTDENIDYLKNANSQANILFLQKYSKDGNIDAPFFIPYNLNVTLDGISGIKLFEKFRMSKGVLPLTYDEGEIALIVKAISHTIDTKQWTTKLETLSVNQNSGALKAYSISTSTNTSTTESTSESTSSNPELWTDKTITSGFPLNPKGHQKKLVNKTGIILHYSAGSQKSDKGKSTIDFLNKRGLSYHYIIDATGHIEQLLPDKTIAYHAKGANQFTIGISLLNYGYGKDINTSSYGAIPSNQTKNAQLVDWNEKPTTYRKITWSQEITDAQLNALKTLFVKLKQNNPGIPSYKWEGEKTWKQLFPNGISYTRANQGLFTHCSVTTQKLDCLPTPKIVKFFKELTL